MNPIIITVGTIIATNILTNLVTRWPAIFKGFDSDIINGLATFLVLTIIGWLATVIHKNSADAQVVKATEAANTEAKP